MRFRARSPRVVSWCALLAITVAPSVAGAGTRVIPPGGHCGAPEPGLGAYEVSALGDCTTGFTNPQPIYDPVVTWFIPVVVHILMDSSGVGDIADGLVASQIAVLNEDYQAIPGTPGEPGTDVKLQFFLATRDPDGNPTSGITRTVNDTWYWDDGDWYTPLHWDPNRYLNIYTNNCWGAFGLLGYINGWPAAGIAGQVNDGVVCYYGAFGRPSPHEPYNRGRTATHEIGHYFGLFHTFHGGCSSSVPPACYMWGDRICDTNPQQSATIGCPDSLTTCGFPAPFHNYMDYTDDACMWEFTVEQTRRIRCTIQDYRPLLYTAGTGVAAGGPIEPNPSLSISEIAPNPFTGETTLRFSIARAGELRLTVFDAQGRRVRQIAGGVRAAGEHSARWNGRDAEGSTVAAGVYYARLEAGGEAISEKMVLR